MLPWRIALARRARATFCVRPLCSSNAPQRTPQILPVTEIGDDVLRLVSKEISLEKLRERDTQELIDDMLATLDHLGGLGLAAPQVNHGIRLFVVEDGSVVVNPVIQQVTSETVTGFEGCFSVEGGKLVSTVERPIAIKVAHWDLDGAQISKQLQGLDAVVYLHETDHLNGVLLPDHWDTQQVMSAAEYEALCEAVIHEYEEAAAVNDDQRPRCSISRRFDLDFATEEKFI